VKHTDYFDSFMTNTVNLGKFRLDLLDERVQSIYTAVCDDDEFGWRVLSMKRQGSWAQRTIIEPQNGKEFDGDVMIRLEVEPEWADNPSSYTNALYRALRRALPGHDITRKARCARISYAGMHIDLVPYILRDNGTEAIINRDENEFEDTDPTAFTDWMREQDEIADGNLRKVIRLVKYLRDHKNSFTGTKSIILTTLLGERVDEAKKLWTPEAYRDLPTALLTIVTDLDEWLKYQFAKPRVLDPSGTGLDFDHRWNDESFYYFKARIRVHAEQIRAAYDEQDAEQSVAKWQDLFGEEFQAPVTTSSSKFAGAGAGAGAGAATTTGRTGRAG